MNISRVAPLPSLKPAHPQLAGVLLLGVLSACGSSGPDAEATAGYAPSGAASTQNGSSASGATNAGARDLSPGATPAVRDDEQGLPTSLAPGANGSASAAPGAGRAGDLEPGNPSSGANTAPLDPILPELEGDCPEFVTGTQTILGLSTEIVAGAAGAPGAKQGPLLFTWHGTGGNGKQALLQLPQSVREEIVAEGGIIIAPSSSGQVRAGQDVTFVLGVWYDAADLKFADQLVACAVQNHNIDPRRIYVTGCSAGGLMAGVMSLERSKYVAAVAPNSGGIVAPLFQLEDPSRVPAVMSMYGGSSDNVIVNFGDTTRNLTNQLKPAGAFVVECNHGMGHCGAPASLHENAWQFMQAHPFGTRPSPYANGLPADFPSFCAIE